VAALPFPRVVVALAALALLGGWLRLAGAVVLHAVDVVRAVHRPSSAPRRSSATPLVRRTVLVALGLSLPVAALLPAQADPTNTLAGVPLPDRTTGRVEHPRTVTVRAGDCLWSIARRLLPPAADTGRVAREVRALGALNAPAIGPDADLIFPGTRLVVPPRDRPGKEQP
jgi:nucleoid-associated protein YgaU